MNKKHLPVVLFLLISVQCISAFNWPVTDPLVTSTFGSRKWGSFGNGIELYGEGQDVRASEEGEIIFFEDNSSKNNLPSGLGNFIVVEHERKLRTLYSGIEPVDDIAWKERVTPSDILGQSGSSGKSSRPNLYFSVIDSEFEQYVNPLLLLNSIVDNKAPVVREIVLENSDGYFMINKKTVVKSGDFRIIAEIYDPCMSNDFFCPMAPYKIHLFLNGEEIFYINFESMRYEACGGVIQSRDEPEYSDFYNRDGRISLGRLTLVPGDLRFEVLVSDYSGNERAYAFQLTVAE